VPDATRNGQRIPVQRRSLRLPLIGEIDTNGLSLPLLTVMIAGMDAFNPCAFFVLLFLLSLLVHQSDRRRMALIGGVFVAFSGLMYFAFMAAWLNLFLVLGSLPWVTGAAGLLALLMGAVNVKDFVRFRQGLSLSISDSGKATIFQRARRLLAADSLPAMLAATVVLAVSANFYELLCTAGFPMVFTRLLTLQGGGAAQHYLYLALYNVIYVLPLLAIVIAFVRTMGARKLSEREGRLLKLLSGLMMLGLGALLLLAPEKMGNLGMALAIPLSRPPGQVTAAGEPQIPIVCPAPPDLTTASPNSACSRSMTCAPVQWQGSRKSGAHSCRKARVASSRSGSGIEQVQAADDAADAGHSTDPLCLAHRVDEAGMAAAGEDDETVAGFEPEREVIGDRVGL
jgi:hypothetical protein